MPEVYVHLAEGRTPEQKRTILQEVTDVIVRTLAVDPNNVVVTIIETPRQLKAKGGVPFSER
jgi:4-oxalocrotonate tautomerase